MVRFCILSHVYVINRRTHWLMMDGPPDTCDRISDICARARQTNANFVMWATKMVYVIRIAKSVCHRGDGYINIYMYTIHTMYIYAISTFDTCTECRLIKIPQCKRNNKFGIDLIRIRSHSFIYMHICMRCAYIYYDFYAAKEQSSV